ncbi:uncharacterized protein LOC128391369 [Panonychus citri]|uniref:uncharacterized protein LOC128391369 n=1 Tax=Panonychus citri TaxID=50023 RepID=UPI00230787F8|nr:uncharacterized protein LOC128391369 [Panonychus citri]
MDQEVTDKNFHYQLLFYETLLDREGALNSLSSASEKAELETKTASCTSLYQSLYQLVRSLRLTMSYTDVNLPTFSIPNCSVALKSRIKIDRWSIFTDTRVMTKPKAYIMLFINENPNHFT